MNTMFWFNARFQIAAICILAVLLFDYARRKRLKTYSNRVFTTMLIVTALNLVFDLSTVYTIWHMDTVPPFVNRLCHQLFIGSLNTMAYILFLYIAALTFGKPRAVKPLIALTTIPYAITMLLVFFAPLEYHVDEFHAYSYGLMAYSVFICVTIYILMIDLFVWKYRARFSARRRMTMYAATVIWVVTACIQYFRPWLLMSSLGVTLMVLYIYLTFENPHEQRDPEAKCFNRQALRMYVTEKLTGAGSFAALQLTLTDLSDISRRHGSHTASRLLAETAQELQTLCADEVFHYRSNSLVVVSQSGQQAAAWCKTIIQRMEQPISVRGMRFRPAYRLDSVACPQYAESCDDLFAMLSYLRSLPRPAGTVMTLNDDARAALHRREQVRRIVEDAVKNNGLDVVYQPIYSVKDGAYISAEALVRIRDRETVGYIPPDEFIPLAERSGAIVALGDAVLEKVCALWARERPDQYGLRYIEVNLSGMQMDDPELADRLLAILKKYQVDPTHINFEVTESVAVASGETFARNVRTLRAAGSSFSMDDFGTGYSNLAQVAKKDYDMIKFDKSLLWPCFSDNSQSPRIVLEAMTHMAGALSLPIVAEGVETDEQARHLTALGVQHMQGYLYSKPVGEVAFMTVLQNGSQRPAIAAGQTS